MIRLQTGQFVVHEHRICQTACQIQVDWPENKSSTWLHPVVMVIGEPSHQSTKAYGMYSS